MLSAQPFHISSRGHQKLLYPSLIFNSLRYAFIFILGLKVNSTINAKFFLRTNENPNKNSSLIQFLTTKILNPKGKTTQSELEGLEEAKD